MPLGFTLGGYPQGPLDHSLPSSTNLYHSRLCDFTGWLALQFWAILPSHRKWDLSQMGYWDCTQLCPGSLLAGMWASIRLGSCWATAGLGSFPWFPGQQRWQQGASGSGEHVPLQLQCLHTSRPSSSLWTTFLHAATRLCTNQGWTLWPWCTSCVGCSLAIWATAPG